MFYMNGDNNLTDEVLSAVDRLETVGPSTGLSLAVLVDGHPDGVSRFGDKWAGTHLLHITKDDRTGVINSTVLEDWGETDLGHPKTLTRFIRTARRLFPADRYIFCVFAHGRGVIDTGVPPSSGIGKSLSISVDTTSQTMMSLPDFQKALANGLEGHRFSLTVLCSCLSGMVEIGYSLAQVSDYLIASQDEVRLVNVPPGAHQLRGIAFDRWLPLLQRNPEMSDIELGRSIVEDFIAPYRQEIKTIGLNGRESLARFPAGLALIDCRALECLAGSLDELAGELIDALDDPDSALPALAAIRRAQQARTFKSFFNLEYYDLLGWLNGLHRASADTAIRRRCRRTADLLTKKVVLFERHTPSQGLGGISIFFSHHHIPENIFAAHRAIYRKTRFSRDTRWDRLIAVYRRQARLHSARFHAPSRPNQAKKTGAGLSKTPAPVFEPIYRGTSLNSAEAPYQ